MAGSYAKIFNEIWADPDFRTLDRDQQWLFFALISQPEMNFAGVLTTTDRRLTGCAAGFTVDELHVDLKALQERRYIVFDEEHDEILVRSYIRHDGAWRTPNVLKSIIRDASVVRSQRIRATLAEEFGRLRVDDVSGKKSEEMREGIARVIETLKPRVSGRVTPTLRPYVPEPSPEPIAEPTVVVAVVGEGVKDRTSVTSPQNPPAPPGPAASGDGVLIQLADVRQPKGPEPGSDDDPKWLRFWAIYPNKVSKKEARVKWAKLVGAGVGPDLIIDGAKRYADEMRRKRVPKDKIKHPDGWLNGERWDDELDDATPATPGTSGEFGYQEVAAWSPNHD